MSIYFSKNKKEYCRELWRDTKSWWKLRWRCMLSELWRMNECREGGNKCNFFLHSIFIFYFFMYFFILRCITCSLTFLSVWNESYVGSEETSAACSSRRVWGMESSGLSLGSLHIFNLLPRPFHWWWWWLKSWSWLKQDLGFSHIDTVSLAHVCPGEIVHWLLEFFEFMGHGAVVIAWTGCQPRLV